jgi:hypothetical protein
MENNFYEQYELFYSGKYTVLYDCSKEVPHLSIALWKGLYDVQDQKFIDEINLSLNFIKNKQIVAMISDHSDLKPVPQIAMDLVHKTWYPTAYKNGLRIEACLKPYSAVADLSLKRMINKTNISLIHAITFPNFKEAYDFCKKFLEKY